MKTSYINKSLVALVVLTFAAPRLAPAADIESRPPPLDAEGRFWVYRNGPVHPPMPFVPYGWMSDSTNLTRLIHIDLDCQERPNAFFRISGPPEKQACIQLKISWDDATWASIAFISGPSKPAWWGENKNGRHYNLDSLAKKKLVFFARGERGGEVIKAQIGALSGKPFGDSLAQPIIGDELKLPQDWTRYELDLKDVPSDQLKSICNGFGVIVERASQPGTPTETQFYIDDVYYE